MSEILERLANEEAGEKRERLNRAKKDFGYFCRTYLSDYFFTDSAEYQRVLYDVADTQSLSEKTAEKLKCYVHEKYHVYLKPTEKLSGAMFVEPREHGKTVRWSFAYVLWGVLTGRKRYALLIGASGDSARENCVNIKRELEENEAILADYGYLATSVWRDDRLVLANNTCIQAKGSGATMRGTRYRQYRPDLIVLDDIIKDIDATSIIMRQKIHIWLKKVVFNLGKTAFIIWVNTIFHSDDPISRLMNELEEGALKRWIAVRLSCLLPNDQPLWPEYWSKEHLEEKRDQLGFDVFSTEYCNEPLSDEERIMHREWIDEHAYESAELPDIFTLRRFGGVDPATGKHDRTADVTVAVDKMGTIFILEAWGKTCSETETIEQLIIKHKKFRYEIVGWEEVVFSGIYANYVVKMAAQQNVYLPIKKIKIGSDSKISRIRSLSPLIENGIIRFPKNGCKELKKELTEFPKGRYDDLCDALFLAVATIQNGESATVIEKVRSIVKTSARSIIARSRR